VIIQPVDGGYYAKDGMKRSACPWIKISLQLQPLLKPQTISKGMGCEDDSKPGGVAIEKVDFQMLPLKVVADAPLGLYAKDNVAPLFISPPPEDIARKMCTAQIDARLLSHLMLPPQSSGGGGEKLINEMQLGAIDLFVDINLSTAKKEKDKKQQGGAANEDEEEEEEDDDGGLEGLVGPTGATLIGQLGSGEKEFHLGDKSLYDTYDTVPGIVKDLVAQYKGDILTQVLYCI
jgi:hypothetical protein